MLVVDKCVFTGCKLWEYRLKYFSIPSTNRLSVPRLVGHPSWGSSIKIGFASFFCRLELLLACLCLMSGLVGYEKFSIEIELKDLRGSKISRSCADSTEGPGTTANTGIRHLDIAIIVISIVTIDVIALSSYSPIRQSGTSHLLVLWQEFWRHMLKWLFQPSYLLFVSSKNKWLLMNSKT